MTFANILSKLEYFFLENSFGNFISVSFFYNDKILNVFVFKFILYLESNISTVLNF